MAGSLLVGLLALLATGIPVGVGLAMVGVVVGYFTIGDSSMLGVPSSSRTAVR
ncbi:MAG: hypothetical protein AAFZ09_03630 [Pseudomonadota bacterium]